MSNLLILNNYNKLIVKEPNNGFIIEDLNSNQLTIEKANSNLVIPTERIKFLSVAVQGVAGADANLELEIPSAYGDVSGFSTAEFIANYNTNIGDLVYLDNNIAWNKCDANDVTKCNGLLGVTMEAKNQGDKVLIALPGSFISSSSFPSLIIGSPIYIGENEGEISTAIPTTSGVVIRVIGWGIAADKLYFYPSPDYITRV